MSKRLIVTADDFGMSMEVNEAVEEAHREGILTCASLVVAGDAAQDAVKRAKRLPGLGVGLHLAIFGAKASARGEVPTLISAIRVRVTASKPLTLLLSGFTHQMRSLPVARSSKAILDEEAGRVLVSTACTAWKSVRVRITPVSSVAVSVTV